MVEAFPTSSLAKLRAKASTAGVLGEYRLTACPETLRHFALDAVGFTVPLTESFHCITAP